MPAIFILRRPDPEGYNLRDPQYMNGSSAPPCGSITSPYALLAELDYAIQSNLLFWTLLLKDPLREHPINRFAYKLLQEHRIKLT